MADMSAYYARRQQGVNPLINYFQGLKQDQTAAANAEQQRKMNVLVEMMRANPAHISEIMASNPDAFNGVQFDPSTFTPTRQERLSSMVTDDAIKQFPNLPQSVRQQGTYQMGYGAAMPSESVKMTSAQDVYAHPDAFAPQMQERQGIEDKTLLNADEQQKALEWWQEFQDIKQPESTAKIAETNASTGLKKADTRLTLEGKLPAEKALATERLAGAGEHVAKTKQLAAGGDVEVVSAWKARVDRGEIAASDLPKYIKDPGTLKAVQNLVATGQGPIQQPLTPAATKIVGEIIPIRQQMDDLIKRLEPYKDNNDNFYFTKRRALYALGQAPDEATLAGQIANLELSKITGGMPYATKSRNFQYIKQIQEHLPRVWVDSPKNVYDKLKTSRANLDRILQVEQDFGRAGHVSPNPVQPGATSLPALSPAAAQWLQNNTGNQ